MTSSQHSTAVDGLSFEQPGADPELGVAFRDSATVTLQGSRGERGLKGESGRVGWGRGKNGCARVRLPPMRFKRGDSWNIE